MDSAADRVGSPAGRRHGGRTAAQRAGYRKFVRHGCIRLSPADAAAGTRLGKIGRGIPPADAPPPASSLHPRSFRRSKRSRPPHALAKFSFKGEAARALFAGLAAHSFLPLEALASAAFGLVLGAAGHAVGWPLPRGGAQAIADALASVCANSVARSKPAAASKICSNFPKPARSSSIPLAGNLLASRASNFPRVTGDGWSDFPIRPAFSKSITRSPSPCLGGPRNVVRPAPFISAARSKKSRFAEREVARGRHPTKPFVLVAQQSLFDQTRAPAGRHTLWAYCHAPHGSDADLSATIENQIERFAPGFRDCILARHSAGAADLQRTNPKLIGGDISGGSNHLWQLLARPVLSPRLIARPRPAFIFVPPRLLPGAACMACAAITPRAPLCAIALGFVSRPFQPRADHALSGLEGRPPCRPPLKDCWKSNRDGTAPVPPIVAPARIRLPNESASRES